MLFSFFFFNDTATTEIYTLSLHDALPIYAADQVCRGEGVSPGAEADRAGQQDRPPGRGAPAGARSEEHTSELQSRLHLVCRLLLEKKKSSSHFPLELLGTFEERLPLARGN